MARRFSSSWSLLTRCLSKRPWPLWRRGGRWELLGTYFKEPLTIVMYYSALSVLIQFAWPGDVSCVGSFSNFWCVFSVSLCATRQETLGQSSQLTEPLWTDPGLKKREKKEVVLVCAYWSPLNKKKSASREWIVKPSPKILASAERASVMCVQFLLSKGRAESKIVLITLISVSSLYSRVEFTQTLITESVG